MTAQALHGRQSPWRTVPCLQVTCSGSSGHVLGVGPHGYLQRRGACRLYPEYPRDPRHLSRFRAAPDLKGFLYPGRQPHSQNPGGDYKRAHLQGQKAEDSQECTSARREALAMGEGSVFTPELSTEGIRPKVERENAKAQTDVSSPPAAGGRQPGPWAGPQRHPRQWPLVGLRHAATSCSRSPVRIPCLGVRGESWLLRGPRLLWLSSSCGLQ